jgi:hypothetical protein
MEECLTPPIAGRDAPCQVGPSMKTSRSDRVILTEKSSSDRRPMARALVMGHPTSFYANNDQLDQDGPMCGVNLDLRQSGPHFHLQLDTNGCAAVLTRRRASHPEG